MDRQEFLTPQEVATLLRLNAHTVYRMLAAREIPARKLGGKWRISRRRLIQWMEGGQ